MSMTIDSIKSSRRVLNLALHCTAYGIGIINSYTIKPPPEDINKELEEIQDEVDGEEDKRKARKQRIPRQPVTEGPRKPWRDPDKHPKDIHYFHSNPWSPTPPNATLTSPAPPLARYINRCYSP